MNPTPSPIASPIPSSRPAATPFQSALAAQIGALTHLVDGMERFQSVAVPRSTVDYLEGIIEKIHSTIDALNTLYDTAGSTQLDLDSLTRRLKWAQHSAEKHHNGNIAACEREVKVRDALAAILDCAELNQDEIEPETRATINAATRVLCPVAS